MRAVSISDRYEATEGTVLLSGIEALVRLLLTQRDLDRARDLSTALFISGYEGSPLGGLDQQLQRAHHLLSEADIVFSPGLNEELAATAVGGTQLTGELPGRRVDGVVGFWYGKNPGLDRAADAIRHANVSGTSPLGGAVALVGDDPMSKSSTLPSSCEQMARALGLPVLAPSSVGDIIPLGLHAVALSRHAGSVERPEDRRRPGRRQRDHRHPGARRSRASLLPTGPGSGTRPLCSDRTRSRRRRTSTPCASRECTSTPNWPGSTASPASPGDPAWRYWPRAWRTPQRCAP